MRIRKWGYGLPPYTVNIWHPYYQGPVSAVMETKAELKLLLLGSTSIHSIYGLLA
jgi:hypothetical protein